MSLWLAEGDQKPQESPSPNSRAVFRPWSGTQPEIPRPSVWREVNAFLGYEESSRQFRQNQDQDLDPLQVRPARCPMFASSVSTIVVEERC